MATIVTYRALVDGVSWRRSASGFLDTQFTGKIWGGKANLGFGVKCAGYLRRGSVVKSVLDKSSEKAGTSGSTENNGSFGFSEHTDPAIAALERLFQEAHWHEGRLGDPRLGESGIELALSELEVDLNAAVNALRAKEQELRAAEEAVKADQWEVQLARSALLHREKELEAAYGSHSLKRDELKRVHETLILRGEELQDLEEIVKERETQLREVQGILGKKQEHLSKFRSLVSENDDALADAASKIRLKEIELEQASDLLSRQVTDIDVLQAALLKKDTKIAKMYEDRQWKQGLLENMEAELEERTKAWYSAQEDLKALERELASSKVRGRVRETEFSQLKVLLTEVQAKLEKSQISVENLRTSIDEQSKLIELHQKDLVSQKSMLALYEENLKSAKIELEKEQEQTKLARLSYEVLQKELKQEREVVTQQQTDLLREKSKMQELMANVNSRKREIQQRDSALSDTQLTLQMKEAELVGAKLELQHVKADLSSVKLALSKKDIELQSAKRFVETLQEEVMHVRDLLQTKEAQLSKVTLLLRKKEEEVASLKVDLDDSHAQLNEATSVVQQFTELSRALVDSTVRQDGCEDESILMQKNLELLATKRALFETELQVGRLQEEHLCEGILQQEVEAELKAVKEALRETDCQLLDAQAVLASKDKELQDLISRWDARERELIKMREEIIEEAKVLSKVRMTQFQGQSGDSTALIIQAERAKMDAQEMMKGLRSLTNLSYSLVEKCRSPMISENVESAPLVGNMSISLASEDGGGLEELKAKLCERDVALEITKSAMENLTNLTKRLMQEAGFGSLGHQGIASAGA